ncbi:DUF6705 family protein [Chryseobacterium populi]|uniref:DUF6705 domain-containing protein n=1 Tax=Chryseobacterium populi TaxID=1144316 RepID=J2KPW8_9FLAO|nr:DUF6705 family protein [Chryseobacterium populi]EJL75098.1 hypothetical protein PMI13_00572 [Chryseobacterium populi]
MKITYLKTAIILLGLMISSISCRAQNLPLNTALTSIPNGAHLKDTNNELSPYIGTYKANFNGNEIILFITKQIDKLENSAQKSYYMDALIVKYIVKNSSGNVLQDTQNNNLPNIELYSIGTRPNQNTVLFLYSGTNCSVGWGDIFLKKINATQLSWEYRPDDISLTSQSCPGNPDKTIYLPKTKDLIFTKQ